MVKAVIFDGGGVIFKLIGPHIIPYCSNHLKVSEGDFRSALEVNLNAFQKGMPEYDFWQRMCDDLECSLPTINSLWAHAIPKLAWNEDVLLLAGRLKQNGYKIGYLSNTEKPVAEKIRAEPGITSLMDALVMSCDTDVRCVKPEPEIYNIITGRLGVDKRDALFIDDTPSFCKGAIGAGLHAIVFHFYEQAVAEIRSDYSIDC